MYREDYEDKRELMWTQADQPRNLADAFKRFRMFWMSSKPEDPEADEDLATLAAYIRKDAELLRAGEADALHAAIDALLSVHSLNKHNAFVLIKLAQRLEGRE